MHRLLLLLIAIGTALASASSHAADIETKARQAFMIEATTGTVLLEKNADEIMPPASLAKLMTMEVVFDALKRGEIAMDTLYSVSEHAWRTGGAPSGTSTMFAALKSQVSVRDLIQGVVVQNANDGCIILAEGMTGLEREFAERMTRRARELGLPKSTFANSTGLPDPGNLMTLREIALVARQLQVAYPEFYSYYAQPEFEWNKILQRNRNPLLAFDIGVDGVGTGFAEGSGYSIVSSIDRDGKRLILALGGLASDKERTEEAKRVLEWGIANFSSRRIFAAGEVIGQASVYGGEVRSVDLIAKEPVDIFVAVDNPERISARIIYSWPLNAPVEADRQVGTLRVLSGNRLLREVPLYTASAIAVGGLSSRALDALQELLFFWL
ncbi:D-alanyl-D-alanine carboxypeptidase [Rhizobiaceae bacterium n13]|uniref:serine-type D-Ala-D-Ala carboxypeptidase n=1 Tax=Ferirhizobium litorale TaxID=2927786 RepID=A0AAE3QJ95_9HYPH|nr:D-alanyl-D-alanine carboxypeptidase family protein [Fererhizobium litorale]MDI7864106.1 D-alanyl-D-alanine carboxypeptidase [Fererhizobium litorale]MDI7924441.1 D-alanyl-D-alanine carboxypeptidase [Fererhizobium litorale]